MEKQNTAAPGYSGSTEEACNCKAINCNKRKENSPQGLQSPFRCVSDLPAIMRLRNQIIEEGKIKDNQDGPGEAKRRKIEFSDS